MRSPSKTSSICIRRAQRRCARPPFSWPPPSVAKRSASSLASLQILPEQRRDQWAALIHRPVERATIYRGKAIAGILMYLFATIVPFLISVWYVSSPGHFASPFVPRTVYSRHCRHLRRLHVLLRGALHRPAPRSMVRPSRFRAAGRLLCLLLCSRKLSSLIRGDRGGCAHGAGHFSPPPGASCSE